MSWRSLLSFGFSSTLEIALTVREKLWHLFEKYDREHELMKEHIRREGFIMREVDRVNHADESRPE